LNHVQLTGLDLNLLRVLDVLIEERSVTRSGARLGLTPSAVSHALSRLRYQLGDELFRRDAQGMQPTRKTLEIAPSLRAALAQLQSALAPDDFDPGVSDRRFTVLAGAYACAVVMPAVVAGVQKVAPNVVIEITESGPDLAAQLDGGQADFVVAGVAAAPDRFARERILVEALTWVVRAGHPLLSGPVTLEALVGVPHVVVTARRDAVGRPPISLRSSWEDLGAFESELAKRRLRRRIGVVAPDTVSAMMIVASTDMAALVPRRFAAQSGRLAPLEPPYETPPVDISLMYRKDRLAEPPMAWLRAVFSEATAEL
jgi:DNA-binding transcriptional LysR family regulator